MTIKIATSIFFLIVLTSCNKVFVKFKDAEATITDGTMDLNMGTGFQNEISFAFENDKILRVGSNIEYDSLIAFIEAGNSGELPLINGILPSTHFSGIDFTQENLFVIFLEYEGQSFGELKRDKLKIKESTEEIEFNFKLKVPVGGSGMFQAQKLVFFKIPIEQANYSISGAFEVDERNAVSSNHDFTVNYTLP